MANAIEHSPVKGEVQIRTVLRPDRLEIEVRGPGEFQAPDRLKNRESRGLGLPLMAKLSDHLALFSGPNGQTFVSLTFYRPGAEIKYGGVVPPSFANLAEENRLLDDVLKNFPEGFYVLDQDWRFVYLNPAVCRSVGRTAEELLGAVFWEEFPEREAEARPLLERVRETGLTADVLTHDARGFWRESTVFPVEEGLAVISRDITERKQAEQALRERERELSRAQAIAQLGSWRWDLQTGVVTWSKEMYEIFGVSPQTFTPSNEAANAMLHPDDRARHAKSVGVALTGIPVPPFESRIIWPSGEERVVLASGFDVDLDSEGTPVGLFGAVQDITMRKRTEEALHDSEEQFRVLTENLTSAVALINERGELTIVNKSFLRLFDLDDDEDLLNINSRDWSKWQVFDEAGRLLDVDEHPVRKAMRTRAAVRDVLVAMQCPGCIDRKWVLISTEPILDAKGELQRLICTYHDITEHRLAEAALKESELRYRAIVETAAGKVLAERKRFFDMLETLPVMVCLLTPGHHVAFANRTFREKFGEDEGRRCYEYRCGLDQPCPFCESFVPLATGKPHHWEFTSPDGNMIVDAYDYPFTDADGLPLILEMDIDITDRKRAERALRDSEEKFRTLFDSIDDGYCVIEVIFDEAGKPVDYLFLEVNEAFERQTGIENAAGRRMRDIAPQHEQHWFDIYGEVARTGKPARFENAAKSIGHYYDVYAFSINEPERHQVAVLFTDISEQRRALAALRESEERHRLLAEENERLYRQQLDIAESLQLALLNIPSEMGPVRLGHLYRSATEAARVGGDFYDAFEVKDGKIAMMVGDVAGHGIEAARTATLVKDVVHAFIHQSLRPHQVLRRTNALLLEKNLPGFVTVFLAILDTGTGVLRYASAGHPETLLRRASGEIQVLGIGSAPLGVYSDAVWKAGEVELEAGDLLLLYTDGVIEARRDGELFGQQRLERLLRRKRVSVERLPHLVLDQLLAFSQGTLNDDVAILALLLRSKTDAAAGGKPVQGTLLD